MADIDWVQILCGGLGGFLLKAVYDRWQNRRQPIRYSIDKDQIFSANPDFQAKVTVRQGETTHDYEHLTLVRVVVTNRGNKDFDSFTFGLTLPNGHDIVVAQCDSVDRHHSAAFTQTPSPAMPMKNLDLKCVPFNRKELYTVKMYVRSETSPLAKEDVKVSTGATGVRLFAVASSEDGQYQREVIQRMLLVALICAGFVAGFMFMITFWYVALYFTPRLNRIEADANTVAIRVKANEATLKLTEAQAKLSDENLKSAQAEAARLERVLGKVMKEHPEWVKKADKENP
jgi:hypothetical protein